MKERKETSLLLRTTAFLLALALLLSCCWFSGWLLMPKRRSYGSLWEQYRQEDKDSLDLLFFGSSVVYCDVAPAWIWEESGLRSWVMAGPEQTMPLTYYYIREALKTQRPRLILLEVTGLLFREYENYSKANVSTMPLSLNRLAATLTAVEREERKGLLFPMFNYHYRWTEIKGEELSRRLRRETDPLAGYTPLGRAIPQERRINEDRDPDPEVYEKNLRYLARIRNFCRKKGVELQLYLSPSAAELPPELRERISGDLAALEIPYMDLSELAPEIGIDYGLDWYDPLHFNLSGAEKFSRWWGETLSARLTPDPDADGDAWRERLEALRRSAEEVQSG